MKKSNWIGLSLLLIVSFSFAADEAQPASKKKMTLQDLLKATSPSSSAPTATAGVRGLDETNAGIDTKARNFPAVDRLDHVVIHEDELKKFIAEGGLK
jgi:hypothetical protein